jgi:hypothetical protein
MTGISHKDRYPIDVERIFLIGMFAGGLLLSLATTLEMPRLAHQGRGIVYAAFSRE